MFDFGILKQTTPEIPSIGVGNLTVGGTGKTPVVDFLLKKLKSENGITVISRGYGRKTKGLRVIADGESPETVGDEPYMLFSNHPEVQFIVSEKRINALDYLKKENSGSNILIFDDVFQHRWVKSKVMIMLSDFNRPFFNDSHLPVGNLRESRSGAKRADIILVTKCPVDLNPYEKDEIKNRIAKYSDAKVYFSEMISSIEHLKTPDKEIPEENVVLVSGLADNEQFFESLKNKLKISDHFKFPDHYKYSESDIKKILNYNLPVVTTEKDIVKFKAFLTKDTNPDIYISKIMLKIDDEDGFWDYLSPKLK